MKVISKRNRSLFAAALEKLLANKGLFRSKAKWAAFLGVSEVAISNWLTDKNAPKPEHLNKIFDLFKEDRYFPEGIDIDVAAFYEMASRHLTEVTPIPDKFKGAKTIDTYMLKPKLSNYFVELTILPAQLQERLIIFNTKLCRTIHQLITFRQMSVDGVSENIARLKPETLLTNAIPFKNIISKKEKKEDLSRKIYALISILREANQFSLDCLVKSPSNLQVKDGKLILDTNEEITQKLQQKIKDYIFELSKKPEKNAVALKKVVIALEKRLSSRGWLDCLPKICIPLGDGKYLGWDLPLRHFDSEHYTSEDEYLGEIIEVRFTKKDEARKAFDNLCHVTNEWFSKIPLSKVSKIEPIFNTQLVPYWKDDYEKDEPQSLKKILSEESEQLRKGMLVY